MKKWHSILLMLACSWGAWATNREVKIKLIETSDIHGNFYPYNFIEQKEWGGSLARVCTYVKEERKKYGDNLLLIDNGDILQGQPTTYYYNYIDTTSTHLAASIMNYMGYVTGNMGNHDVETGHAVYDRWIRECHFPILGANIIKTSDETTYLKPYVIIERERVKIAILGMITPAIPTWLPETLWEGLRFDDMERTARKWMKIIKEKEHPDIIVGVFHAGREARTVGGKYREDACLEVASNVPGFDVVLMGHDHSRYNGTVTSSDGSTVHVINPANKGSYVGSVDISLVLQDGKVIDKKISGELVPMDNLKPDAGFMGHFNAQYQTVKQFVSEKIGTMEKTITTEPAYFGPSAFIDLIHSIQLELTGADVSFSAPLSFNAKIKQGDILISDMFKLYKYENLLYTMRLSGKEIKGFLEESYAGWTNQMKSADDHLLLIKKRKEGNGYMFVNPSFNFDSAAGIIYTVDVSKPKGEKITIIRMANGKPFDMDKQYKVAVNSYRGNGGGELLTK
ncbi:MAG TPA: bifunctional metallophosphatase/5'-nucleotidase, partial [Parabacteroides sp.]|nr:bifunctional metallophosphatase/5'-nucleotidase [Parabacteroides sp.]